MNLSILSESMIRSSLVCAFTFGTITAATLGCRSASNAIPRFKWAAPSNRVPAETSVAMGDKSQQVAAERIAAPTAGSATTSEVRAGERSSNEDSLRGFYPEDLPESTNSARGFASTGYASGAGSSSSVSRTGSFPSSSSSGCTSGCCPH